jgi:hypothetical protein
MGFVDVEFGKKYGSLTIEKECERAVYVWKGRKLYKRQYLCHCDCGRTVKKLYMDLVKIIQGKHHRAFCCRTCPLYKSGKKPQIRSKSSRIICPTLEMDPLPQPDKNQVHLRWSGHLPPVEYEAKFDEPGYMAWYPETQQWLPMTVLEADAITNKVIGRI